MRPLAPLCLVLLSALLAGCTDFEATDATNRIGLVRIDVAAPVVSTGRVTLEVIATLDNLEAESGELELAFKAFDLATNMLVATRNVTVGALAEDTTHEVRARLDLARASGYRIEVSVEQDGRVVQRGQVQVSNVMALQPTVHDTGLRVSSVEAQVGDVADGRVAVDVSVYLTNEGGRASRELRMQVKARETSTGLIADEAWTDVPSVALDATRIGRVMLDVPDDFNYELVAAIWDGDVLVESGNGRVQFLPTYTQAPNTQLQVTNPDISRFDRDGMAGVQGAPYYTEPSYGQTTTQTPGIGLAALVLALLGILVLVRRRMQ